MFAQAALGNNINPQTGKSHATELAKKTAGSSNQVDSLVGIGHTSVKLEWVPLTLPFGIAFITFSDATQGRRN